MLFLAFKKVSPPCPQQHLHTCHPTGMGRFLPYPFNAIWKTLSCFTSPKWGVEIISKYFIVWLWTATQHNTSKNEMSLKVLLVIWEWIFNIPLEIPNMNFEEWKYSQDKILKKVLITQLSKVFCGCVFLFHLVYWISVREWPKYTLTSQQF